MKQTAVDWLIDEIISKDWWYLPESMKQDIIEQAKAMEKEQIIAAHKTATLEAGFEYSADDWANQYYNKTFKSE